MSFFLRFSLGCNKTSQNVSLNDCPPLQEQLKASLIFNPGTFSTHFYRWQVSLKRSVSIRLTFSQYSIENFFLKFKLKGCVFSSFSPC